MILNSTEWLGLTVEQRKRLMEAMRIRFASGEGPVVVANGPMRITVRRINRGQDLDKTHNLLGGEKFRVVGFTREGSLSLVPLDLRILKEARQAKYPVAVALDNFDGFALHLSKIIQALQDETVQALQAQHLARERAALGDALKAQFMREHDEEWGAF